MAFFKAALDNLLGLVFPSRCLLCERPTDSSGRSPLCLEHARTIIPVEPPVCGKCGRKMFGESVESLTCADCRSMKVRFDAGFSCYIYSSDAVRELVHRFKYGKRRYLGTFLGGLMAAYLQRCAADARWDAMVPVPLHWRRYWARGFNQAADLAKPLSRQLHIPVLKRTLRRVRYTRPQVSLPPQERKKNIRNAFKVNRPANVACKNLLLVDDVITTGATLNECARVLKDAGASRVTILTLAHPSDFPTRAEKTSSPQDIAKCSGS